MPNPSPLAALYRSTVLRFPRTVVCIYAVLATFFALQLGKFRMDASSESLVLENDADLKYYEETRSIFGSDDYILLAIRLKKGGLDAHAIRRLEALTQDLRSLPDVEGITSVLTAPLFESPRVRLTEMGTRYRTLLSPDCDRAAALRELSSSPLWKNNLLSADGSTTAVIVSLGSDPGYRSLGDERYRLRNRKHEGTITPEETRRLASVELEYNRIHAQTSARRRLEAAQLRSILARHNSPDWEVAESGLPMIVADMVAYIERDIWVFGIAVLLFLGCVLTAVFRRVQWVLLPLVTCLIPVVVMMGYLGMAGWETTVVTANFSSLLLIVSMQNSIYLVVRYRELHARRPDWESRDILFEAVRQISVPCFYTSATQVAGFATLVVSGIRPIIDFGVLMSTGLAAAYFVNFTFFPAAILLFPKGTPPPRTLATLDRSPLSPLAGFTQRHRLTIGLAALLVLLAGILGTARLTVENRFIDYFRRGTPISRGLTMIDNRLGGTTSLEVVLDGQQADFWTAPANLALLRKVHEYAESMPNVGKVTSLHSLIEILTSVNDGVPPTPLVLNVARATLSDKLRDAYLRPYVTTDFSKTRVFIRIRESSPTLARDAMLTGLKGFLSRELHLKEDQARVTGIFVLYNNLLKSLFDSQIKTLGMVFFIILLMLVALFRSPYLACIAIAPAILPVFLILGTMGWLRISLDVMTIMIASVTCGIAVDNMIQYAFRFREEHRKDGDYRAAMFRSHNSIGIAILYASVTIIAGFGILALSNFKPTVYFGLFTSLAMAAGFLGSLTLLPLLIDLLKPFGPGGNSR